MQLENQMHQLSITNTITELMDAHKVPISIMNEWIAPFGKLPAIRGTWYPKDHNGVLQIEVLLEDKRILTECMAGIGDGDEGIKDAIQSFCVNTYHVLLSAFWEMTEPEQVTIEEWKINNKSYAIYIGNFGTRCDDEVSPDLPVGLFDIIEKTIKNEKFEYKINWYRFYFGNVSGELTFEALKNNEIWEAGLYALKSLPWKKYKGFYSVRNFLVVKEIA